MNPSEQSKKNIAWDCIGKKNTQFLHFSKLQEPILIQKKIEELNGHACQNEAHILPQCTIVDWDNI